MSDRDDTIAALYVETGGVYFGLPGVDPWDAARDARLYAGPWPAICHPPCQRWGRYWHGGPSARVRQVKGDDGGCFASALASVRTWGGVLEHPEASAAWDAFDLIKPPRYGGWVSAGMHDGGFTCCVEQGHYGHRARKATWLYAHGVELPHLRWGPSQGDRLDAGYHTAEERAADPERHLRDRGRLTVRERIDTPLAFRDALIAIARTARRHRAAG
jgi:hypothetical protein